tara:strand:- start:147 stop:611 length:465 start_codon:yes stop_codon:yes gene_type:complete
MTVTKEILASHPVTTLKKEISKTNIKGYSKMKKAQVIELMLKEEHVDKFKDIEMAEKKERKKAVKKGTHKMPDGSVMSGKTHSKDSKVVKKSIKGKKLKVKKLEEKKEDTDEEEIDAVIYKEPVKKVKFKVKKPLTVTKASGEVIKLKKRQKKK